MHYLVDAYNLLFRRLGWHDDLRAQREKMVERLNEKVDLTGWETTLVFDAIHQYGDATRSRHDALDIIFTGEGVTADDHIVDIVKRASHPRSLIVVSSDKRLCWEARNYGADTLSVEEFEAKLNKRY
ncbi:MAG: NYN domain-containing protein, partial [Chlamydiia bacterium]|nr:NYN domain-containing protein [Chlamydiia bacterium]